MRLASSSPIIIRASEPPIKNRRFNNPDIFISQPRHGFAGQLGRVGQPRAVLEICSERLHHRVDASVTIYVTAAQLNSSRRLRGRRATSRLLNQCSRCGCRAAHADIAKDMARSSCWPIGQLTRSLPGSGRTVISVATNKYRGFDQARSDIDQLRTRQVVLVDVLSPRIACRVLTPCWRGS
jgi:hypothetical protein